MTQIEAPRSRAAQIADILRDRIRRGVHAPGSPLPSEPELSREFNVSRPTINRAVILLRNEGLVRVRRGLGVFVQPIPVITRIATRRHGARDKGRGAYDVEIRRLGLDPTWTALVERVPASELLAGLLDVEVGSELVVRRRKYFANDIPTQIADTYLVSELAEKAGVTEENTGQGGTYSRLADVGRGPVHFSEEVGFRGASATEAAFLDMEPNQAVFEIIFVASDHEHRPVAVTSHILPGHQWKLRYEWSDEPESETE
ncbi:GntR family transcriptional regulator [Kribbella sp. NPDC051587]|uniref:GntR family transcriptional regulator n=1 Tax=Kribbella sp. NPDC051587 TaxID=3364119 RepID=UPI0037A57AFF